MAPEKSAPETQEQSIKSRKHQLYDAEPAPLAADTGKKIKTVEDYLRETPAARLSSGMKAGLWASAAVVALLFVGVLLLGDRRPKQVYAPLPEPPERLLAKSSDSSQKPADDSKDKNPADSEDEQKAIEPQDENKSQNEKSKTDSATKTKADTAPISIPKGKFLSLNLKKFANVVSTKGMFDNKNGDSERLIFPDWSPKTFQGVPFQL
ncbi:MAG TPA: hypothetical protein VGZ22_02635, partial [Isosphaeraceae bacterium]|nr:hypothetical protein [Isosphaeraceae bacterium]